MNAELEHIWSRVQAELAQAVEESTYRIWLQPLRPRELSGGGLQIEAPADACGWICERFGRLMQASATLVLGTETAIELVPSERPAAGSESTRASLRGARGAAQQTLAAHVPPGAAHLPAHRSPEHADLLGAKGRQIAFGYAVWDLTLGPTLFRQGDE